MILSLTDTSWPPKDKIKIIMLFIIGMAGSSACSLSDTTKPQQGIMIDIESGTSASAVTHLLRRKGVIRCPLIFKTIMKISKSSRKIQAGSYLFSRNESYFSILKKLRDGLGYYVKVIIPEGFTAEQIAARLAAKRIIDNPDLFVEKVEEKGLRGYLFPDTYKFRPSEEEDFVIKAMKKQFSSRFSEPYREKIESHDLGLEKLVVMASLVEKEAKVASERPVIASIFRRRMKKKRYLESCASVQFALGEHHKRLTYKDLEVDSPYNTYRNFGLPPTAICNPGLASLLAALDPADTEYLFFFAKGDGSHEFSESYERHLAKQKTPSLRRH
jgi:UPF0755 protein